MKDFIIHQWPAAFGFACYLIGRIMGRRLERRKINKLFKEHEDIEILFNLRKKV